MALDITTVGLEFTSQGYPKVSGELDDLHRRTTQTERDFGSLNTASGQLTSGLVRHAASVVSLYGAYRTLQTGWRFNQLMEDSEISLTALLASLYEYRNASGKVATGMEAFNLAQKDAVQLQADLRIAGLKTAATYEELQNALAQSFVPAKDAGIALDNMITFVTRFVQVASAARVPLNMLGEEVRNFLQGGMQERTTRVMPFMVGIGLTNDKIKELVASGKLYEEFMKRSEQLAIAADRASRTWTVALSNAKDAIQNLLGAGFEGSFQAIKDVFLGIANYIVQVDQAAGTIQINPDLVSGLREIDHYLTKIIKGFQDAAAASATFSANHPTIAATGVEMGKIAIAGLAVVGAFGILRTVSGYVWRFFATNIATIVGYFGSLLGVLGTVGTALTGLTGAAATLAGGFVAVLAGIVAYTQSDWVRGMVDAVLGVVGEFEIGGWKIKDYWSIAAIAVKDVWNSVAKWLTEWYASLSPETKAVCDTIVQAWDATVQWFKDAWKDAVEIVLGWWQSLKNAASFVVDITLSDQAKEGINRIVREKQLQKEMLAEGQAFEQFSGGPTTKALAGKGKPGDRAGKGGGGGQDTEKQIMSFLQALDRELARLSGSGWRELEQWYQSQLQRISEITKTEKDAAMLRGKLDEVKVAKSQELDRKYGEWYAENTFNRQEMLRQALENDLRQWGNTEQRKSEITEIHNQRRKQSDEDQMASVLQFRQQQIQAMESMTPNLQAQMNYQQQLLRIENELADLALKKFLRQNEDINPAVKEELRTRNEILKALRAEELYRKNLMKMGPGGGLQAWWEDRKKEIPEREAKLTYDMLKEAEQMMSSTLADAFWGAITGKQQDINALGEQIAQTINRKLFDFLTAQVFDFFGGKAAAAIKPGMTPANPLYAWVVNQAGGGGDVLSWLRGSSMMGGQAGWQYGSGQKVGPEFSAYLDAEAQMTGEMDAAKQASSGFFSGITSFFSSIWSTASGWLGKLGSVISDFFSGILNFFSGSSGASGGGGGASGMFSSLFSWIGSIFGFQHGGIAWSPTIAKIAEGGKPEAVVPLQYGSIPVKLTDQARKPEKEHKPMVNHFTFNIRANNPREFLGSESQIMRQVGLKMNYALQKDGA